MLVDKIKKPIINEKELERKKRECINKGGSDPVLPETIPEWTNINLRLKTEMISRIDEITKTKRISMPRTAWIIEAILEKFERDDI